MRKTGYLLDTRFLDHDTGPRHPERPERLTALAGLFAGKSAPALERIDAREASEEELLAIHSAAHVAAVAASAGRAHTSFDPDTPASPGSFLAARLAAGGALALVDAVCEGRIDNGFAALRPPGHHAEATRPMGFCLFNNVAVAARHLIRRHGMRRVLVVDWDVHHGNGTQHSFYDSADVFYASLHQYPFYPGTGAVGEIGHGAGEGTTLNLPMPAGSGDDDYFAALREVLLPVGRAFDPDFVLVSAGFDAHAADPLAGMRLSAAAFGEFTNALQGLADDCAGGRLALLLEGGYDLEALRDSVAASLASLRDPRPFDVQSGELNGWGRQAGQLAARRWGTF